MIVSALLVCASARAYIPPTQYLMARFVDGRAERKLGSLKVVLETTLEPTRGARRMLETLWYVSPWKLRAERQLDDALHVEVRDGNKRRVEEPGQKPKVTAAPIDPLVDLFTCAEQAEPPTHERLRTRLKSLGIDLDKRTLTRFDGRVAILIGADPWEPNKPQLWIDKDGLFPLRIKYRRGKGDGAPLVDVQLLGYGGAKTGSWYPEVIEIYVDGVLERRSVVQEIEVAPKIEPRQFRVK